VTVAGKGLGGSKMAGVLPGAGLAARNAALMFTPRNRTRE
jgi:hypothetical protein